MTDDRADFMRRLALLVDRYLPIASGETFAQYCARVRSEPSDGRRALIAACLVNLSKEIEGERRAKVQALKDAWIAEARKAFSPGRRQECAVCGKYPYLTQAHHLYPLAKQFDDGVLAVDQSFVWLCPNHHEVVHQLLRGDLISQALGQAAPALADMALDELPAILAIVHGRVPEPK